MGRTDWSSHPALRLPDIRDALFPDRQGLAGTPTGLPAAFRTLRRLSPRRQQPRLTTLLAPVPFTVRVDRVVLHAARASHVTLMLHLGSIRWVTWFGLSTSPPDDEHDAAPHQPKLGGWAIRAAQAVASLGAHRFTTRRCIPSSWTSAAFLLLTTRADRADSRSTRRRLSCTSFPP